MAVEFQADLQPTKEFFNKISALAPSNPFYTHEYAAAMQTLGQTTLAFTLRDQDELLTGCTGFLRVGRLNKSLEITSLPTLVDPDIFWQGLFRFCRGQNISNLEVGSFASSVAQIPDLTGEVSRQSRCEYFLDLTNDAWTKNLSSNHRRNLKQAQKVGLQIQQVGDEGACLRHAELINLSMNRRKERGEEVAEDSKAEDFLALTKSGAGQLFQTIFEGQVLSSLMVLMAKCGGYYQSAGSSPAGMSLGASPFLIYSVAEALKANSLEVFNLGGASDDNPGLVRFKAGFGATPVKLEAATYYLGSRLKKKVTTAVTLLREDRQSLVNELLGRPEKLFVYAADPTTIKPPEVLEGATFTRLSDDQLAGLAGNRETEEQYQRFNNLGFNDAYGVFLDIKLAHIAWLITSNHDARNSFVSLKQGEAEITHCLTLEPFRGRGVYPFAIQSLCQIAAQSGIRRVFMITNVKNAASQRGIEKAGLKRLGRVIRLHFASQSLTYRGHRWFGST